MKTIRFILLIVCPFANLAAQTYEIDFAATGATSFIDSIRVEILSRDTSFTLRGSDILRLTVTDTTAVTGIENHASEFESLKVYSNPAINQAFIEFYLNKGGPVLMAIYDVAGRSVLRSDQLLHAGMHEYTISGLPRGMYIVRVAGDESSEAVLLVSRNSPQGNPGITCSYSEAGQDIHSAIHSKQFKSAATGIDITYYEGERLMFTGFSGNYSTVITEVPAENHTVSFEFTDCMDADSNYYPIVTIGSQTWMAKDLKTTKYNDGTSIPQVSEEAAWSALTTPACCWYENDSISNMNIYGTMYNWYTVDSGGNGGKNVCPSGWHVPSDAEWSTLLSYAGSSPGNELRETGTEHWKSLNRNASNKFGFTALPGGGRGSSDAFVEIHISGNWWTRTNISSANAMCVMIRAGYDQYYLYDWYKKCGFYVRCVKDE